MRHDFIREHIRSTREGKGFTQQEMAEKLGMDERTYARIERGEKKNIAWETLCDIANVLEKDVTEFINRGQHIVVENVNENEIVNAVYSEGQSVTINNTDANIVAEYQKLLEAKDKLLNDKDEFIKQLLQHPRY